MRINLVFSLTFLLIISSCTNEPVEEGLTAKNGMVVSAREEASKIGVEILKKGGNAFDAMIATDLALAVSHQSAGNIGGGGFMVYRKANGETGALDYREKAPLSASKDMYLDKQGNVIKGLSLAGAMAIGVPGTIAGIFEVYEKYSRVLLISDINSKIPVRVGESNIKAIISGNNTTKIDLLYLKENLSFNDNDLVYTSGDGGYFNPGIPVGILRKENSIIYIDPLNDLSQIQYINIYINQFKNF